MDAIKAGRQLRALRRRHPLRQDDVALRAGTSRSEVGRTERGDWRHLRVSTLERIANSVGARLDIRLSWNGEALDRLLDAGHATLVEQTVRRLRASGWVCAIEVSFNISGERGSIDVLGFHPDSGSLLVEVKSVVPDVQATLMTLDRKARLGRQIATDRGWSATSVGRLLVVAESRTSRRRVEAHEALFAAALPSRAVAVRSWLGSPSRQPALAGLWFLSSGQPPAARHRVPGRKSDAIKPASVKAIEGSTTDLSLGPRRNG